MKALVLLGMLLVLSMNLVSAGTNWEVTHASSGSVDVSYAATGHTEHSYSSSHDHCGWWSCHSWDVNHHHESSWAVAFDYSKVWSHLYHAKSGWW